MESLENLAKEGWKVREDNFPPNIYFSYPIKTQAVSVTGKHCKLNCGHCGGHYLKHMEALADVSVDDKIHAQSFLVSGGCTVEGKVPIGEHLTKLTALKGDRRFNLHVGLVNEEDVEGIAKIADKISFDFVGDDETIHEVFGLQRTVQDYVDSYERLRKNCKVVPHICIGLHGGEIRGEYKALELLYNLGAEELTFIIFTPTKETRYADCQPPAIEDVLAVIVAARKRFPKVPIHLGCMRPGGRYRKELDPWAVRAGVNSIVTPTLDAVRLASSLGLLPIKREECCAL
jgi:uncharacterized radical SAM superfamily protein